MSDNENSPGCTDSSPCPAPTPLQLFQTILFAVPVLFAILLLLLFCMLHFRRRSRANVHSQMMAPIFARQFLSMPDFDHGLSKSFRLKLPTIPFDEKYIATRADTQCAVCLGDYQLNEKLLQLPVCNHSFHVQCIDEWLSKSTTCPICRTSLLRQGRVGSLDSLQLSDGKDASLHIRADASNGASSSSSETVTPLSIEHLINIERS